MYGMIVAAICLALSMKSGCLSNDPKWIVKVVKDTEAVLFPPRRSMDMSEKARIQASKNILSLCESSEADIVVACRQLDSQANTGSDEIFQTYIVCRLWFLLLYAPSPDKQKETESEFEHYHYPLFPHGDIPLTYDFPWTSTPKEGWMVSPFTYRIQGAVGRIAGMHAEFAGLARRKLH